MKKGANSEKALNKNALSEALISIDKVISAPFGAPHNWRPFGAPIFRFIFVGNFYILFFLVKKTKSSLRSTNYSKTAKCSKGANYLKVR